jgi:hypothetical protein
MIFLGLWEAMETRSPPPTARSGGERTCLLLFLGYLLDDLLDSFLDRLLLSCAAFCHLLKPPEKFL